MPGERERASQSPGIAAAATSSSIATTNGDPPKLKIRFGSTSSKAGLIGQPANVSNGPATPSLTVKFSGILPSASSSAIAAADARSPKATTPVATPASNGHIAGEATGEDASGDRDMSSHEATQYNAKDKGKGRATAESERLEIERAAEAARLRAEADERERLRKQLEIDLQELPDVARQHLVPLYEIIRRVVARSFTDLQSLAEILPARSDADRKRMIIEYVVATRRQVIKLLVLLRWSRDNTKDVERSMNLISFLQRQNFQLERAVDGLRAVRDLLLNARVRNYDILTAVDVLSKGDYLRLPPVFRDAFIPPAVLSATDTLAILRELESVIRYRLQVYETVPLDLQRIPYRIHDGRVTFHVPGFFRASFTLGGDALTDQWYLIEFVFDFKGRGVKQKPSDVMKGHITQTCDAELAKAAQAVKNVPPDAAASTLKSTNAFAQVYAILRQICLNYQIELVAHHAHQANTSPTVWQGRLGIAVSKESTTIDIQYLKPPSLRSNQYSLHFAESCSISISPVNLASTSQDKAAVHDRMSRLLQRLTQASNVVTSATPGGADSPASKGFRLQCICKSSPVWFDPRGKKTNQLPHALAQQALAQRETTRQVSVMDQTSLRDIDDILNECFGRNHPL